MARPAMIFNNEKLTAEAKMVKDKLYKLFLVGCGMLASASIYAQKDTTKKGGVDIISSFKPVLREAAKINFNASPP